MADTNRLKDHDQPNYPPGSGLPRPFSVTLLALGVLSITGMNLARLVLAISRWQFLSSLPGISPLYIALTGLIWGMVGLVLFWSLWRGLSWAPRLMQASMLTYAAYYWLDKIFLAERTALSSQESLSQFLPLNWPFTITITALFFIVTVWILSRPDTKVFFGD